MTNIKNRKMPDQCFELLKMFLGMYYERNGGLPNKQELNDMIKVSIHAHVKTVMRMSDAIEEYNKKTEEENK